MKKNNKTTDLVHHMTDRLNLPRDLMLHDAIVNITGQEELTIENYRGILEYEADHICLSLKHGQIMIAGKHLRIDYYTNDDMKISGMITKIEYSM